MPRQKEFPISVLFRVDNTIDKYINQLMGYYHLSTKAELLRTLICKEAEFAGFIDYDRSRRSKEPPLSL